MWLNEIDSQEEKASHLNQKNNFLLNLGKYKNGLIVAMISKVGATVYGLPRYEVYHDLSLPLVSPTFGLRFTSPHSVDNLRD